MCILSEELRKLKKSSLESVDNEKSFTEFNTYMHVLRQVEVDLITLINRTQSSDKKSLILVCGNVGDGKSHLISFLNNRGDHILDNFLIHNDATESFSRNMDEKQTLAKVLDEFSDEKYDNNSNAKVIVAINLGILSNFIESDYGTKFKRLKAYTYANKILNDIEISENNETDDVFFHVNFADYHIFRLINGKVDSLYIRQIIDKIAMPNENNSLYKAYEKCALCPAKDWCAVKFNFEMLQNEFVRDGLILIIVEAIIKDKLILSTRDLLNFFYDITVHTEFSKKKMARIKEPTDQLKHFVDYSMPSLLYDHRDLSAFLHHIYRYDYLNRRSNAFDTTITAFHTVEDLKDIFLQFINPNPCMTHLLSHNINHLTQKDSLSGKKMRDKLFLYFSRLCKLCGREHQVEGTNEEFNQYVRCLFYYAQNDLPNLYELYDVTEKSIYAWNGSDDKENMNLNNSHEDFTMSTRIKLQPLITGKPLNEQAVFELFDTSIDITFRSEFDSNQSATIRIDYDLYEMVIMVKNGYRPSMHDNNSFINYIIFLNKIIQFGKANQEITIKQIDRHQVKNYSLKKTVFGKYEFKGV